MSKPAQSKASNEEVLAADIFNRATRLHEHHYGQINELLLLWGMTSLQFYTLRILYANMTSPLGMPSGQIGQQLTTRVPDLTRLLDRMVDKGWVTKKRDEQNRRLVRASITLVGARLVESAQNPVSALQVELLSNLNQSEKANLKQLLEHALNG